MYNILLTVNKKAFTGTLFDNMAVAELLDELPLTLNMNDLYNNEKYFELNKKLQADDISVGEVNAGNLMLYNSNTIVLFYKNFQTSFSYTPLGNLNDIENLRSAVGSGSAEVRIELIK